jgi:KipI family sensor histidine kinase inhibitor
MADYPRIEVAGEAALIVYLSDTPSPGLTVRLQALADALRSSLGSALEDLVPSYASLLVLFDPFAMDHKTVKNYLYRCLDALADAAPAPGRLVEIPVYYAPEAGADLEALGERTGLGWEGVAELHAAIEYRVCAVGFAPGFAYLGDVDERIAAPRLATPRTRVPRGSVAIADRQTAVYPAESPGGWNLIGRSPLRMFDAASPEPMPVGVGDRVRFVAIDRADFEARGGCL